MVSGREEAARVLAAETKRLAERAEAALAEAKDLEVRFGKYRKTIEALEKASGD